MNFSYQMLGIPESRNLHLAEIFYFAAAFLSFSRHTWYALFILVSKLYSAFQMRKRSRRPPHSL